MKTVTTAMLLVILLTVTGCPKQENSDKVKRPPRVSLHVAALQGDLDAIQGHIRAGSDLNKKDAYGSTPLIVAATFGRTEVANTLIDAGADMTMTNREGSSPLHIAAFFCHTEIVEALLDKGAGRVALLDVDYHHENGSQSIFYDRADVLYVSLHGDPRQAFPYFLGYADETGTGPGEGYNCNFPMPWGTPWDDYRECLEQGLERIHNYTPDALVVSLGVDTYEKDPISRFKLKSEHFREMGSKIAQKVHCPSLFIMEGGYAVDEIGINVVNLLTGFLNE